jgi:hypothetical protein
MINKIAYLNAIWYRRFGRRLGFGALAYGLIALGVGNFTGSLAAAETTAAILTLFLCLFVAIRYLMARATVFSAKREAIYGERVMEFDETEFRLFHTNGIKSSLPWSQIQMSERSGSFIFLFFTGIQHFMVPMTAFKSPEDAKAFEALVARKTQLHPLSFF